MNNFLITWSPGSVFGFICFFQVILNPLILSHHLAYAEFKKIIKFCTQADYMHGSNIETLKTKTDWEIWPCCRDDKISLATYKTNWHHDQTRGHSTACWIYSRSWKSCLKEKKQTCTCMTGNKEHLGFSLTMPTRDCPDMSYMVHRRLSTGFDS